MNFHEQRSLRNNIYIFPSHLKVKAYIPDLKYLYYKIRTASTTQPIIFITLKFKKGNPTKNKPDPIKITLFPVSFNKSQYRDLILRGENPGNAGT